MRVVLCYSCRDELEGDYIEGTLNEVVGRLKNLLGSPTLLPTVNEYATFCDMDCAMDYAKMYLGVDSEVQTPSTKQGAGDV